MSHPESLAELETRIAQFLQVQTFADALRGNSMEWRLTPPESPDRADRELAAARRSTSKETPNQKTDASQEANRAVDCIEHQSVNSKTCTDSTPNVNQAPNEALDERAHVQTVNLHHHNVPTITETFQDSIGRIVTVLKEKATEIQSAKEKLHQWLAHYKIETENAKVALEKNVSAVSKAIERTTLLRRWLLVGVLAGGSYSSNKSPRMRLAELGLCSLTAERDAHRALQDLRHAYDDRQTCRTIAAKAVLLELLWHDLISAAESAGTWADLLRRAGGLDDVLGAFTISAARSAQKAQARYLAAMDVHKAICAGFFARDQAFLRAEGALMSLSKRSLQGDSGIAAAEQWEAMHSQRGSECAAIRVAFYSSARRLHRARAVQTLLLNRVSSLQLLRSQALEFMRLIRSHMDGI